jgi:hypothetical protein
MSSYKLDMPLQHGKDGRKGKLRQRATLQRTLGQRDYLLEDFKAKWLTAGGIRLNRREMRSFDAKIRELMATGFIFVK